MKKFFFFLLAFLCTFSVWGQPSPKLVRVSVVPDSKDWNYQTGDKARFEVNVARNGIPQENISIRYELSYDMLPPFKAESAVLKDGKIGIDAGTMNEPGFLRCRVFATYDGKEYEGLATAGFSTDRIQPVTTLPADFTQFWDQAKEENKEIPMDARIRLLPERCTEKTNVYELSFQNYKINSRMYGILCVPKAPGKYPAALRVPGAGVRPYYGDVKNADQGMITLDLGIHGVPVTMEASVYQDMSASALRNYSSLNWEDRDRVYYKRVYLGCVRAVDYIFSMEQFDGQHLVVHGGSQGGALSIVTAALDKRVTGLISYYPALSDMAGYLHGRAGGWPHIFRDTQDKDCIVEERVIAARYYDVVNFARQLTIPVYYAFGYNDMVCPPTSTQAVFNVISSNKTLDLVPEIQHWLYPETQEHAWEWAYKLLGK